MVLIWRRRDLHSSSRGNAATPTQSRKVVLFVLAVYRKVAIVRPGGGKGQSLTKILAFKLCVAHFNIFLLSICWSRLFFVFVCFLTSPLKKFRLFFEKDIYTKTKQTVAKMIFYNMNRLQRARYVLIRGRGPRGQIAAVLQLYDEVLHVCFMLAFFFVFVSVNFLFFNSLFSEPSVPTQRGISVLIANSCSL